MSTIRQLLETALAAITPALATAWENALFVPTDSVAYQAVHLMMGTPENPTLPRGFHRELGILQVSLLYPFGNGVVDAEVRAELLKTTFFRGRTFTTGTTTLTIEKTATVMPGRVDGNRWSLPVRIPFFANVFE